MRALGILGCVSVSVFIACGSSNSGSGGGSSGGSSSGSTSSGGSSSGVTNGPVPTIGGCAIFPADDAWNTRVDDTTTWPVDPSSATYIANMAPTTHIHPDWGDYSPDGYGIPWTTVPSTQPGVPITFTQSADQSDPGPYPIPPNAEVEGDGQSGDQHVLVIQTGTCKLFEMWQSSYTNPGWSCGSGAIFDLGSTALRPDGWTSADAAGLPILPGLVKLSEVQAGAINHAIRFTMDKTQQGYIHPATHAAGSADTSLPPMGLRVRLTASFDTSSFTGPSLVVVTALKQYGALLADNGSNWYFSGDSDNGWTSLMDDLNSQLEKVKGSDFEVVQTGTISTAGL